MTLLGRLHPGPVAGNDRSGHARPAARSRVVAVAGGKGSPGCTFVAVGLARCLAAAGLETILLDADAEAPSVAAWLDLPGTGGGFARAAGQGAMTAPAVRALAIPAEGRLRVLEVGTGQDVDGRELAGHARAGHQAVVVDLGHRLDPLQRQLMAAADWIVWVAVPDRLGLDRADRALAGAPRGAGGFLVVNRCGRGSLRGAERLLAEAHGLSLLARIPDRPGAARAVLDRRVPAHRRAPFAIPVREAARTVHPDCLARVKAWP